MNVASAAPTACSTCVPVGLEPETMLYFVWPQCDGIWRPPDAGSSFEPTAARIIASAPVGICSTPMSTQTVRLHRWDEIALEKVTEMLSRKIVTGEREMLAQIYLKRGCLVPMHSHESVQMTYILQGALKFLIGGEEITVREGEVLHIPSWVEHQAEAL